MKQFQTAGVVALFCVAVAIVASAQQFAAENFDFADGGNPSPGPLIQGVNGDLYGTTNDGGANGCAGNEPSPGCGTVFQLSAKGQLSAFYSFCSQANCADGFLPASGVILGGDGNFYGTTLVGGAHGGASGEGGTVFRITPGVKLTTLYSFCSQASLGVCLDGAGPYGLVQATDGNFYGTTGAGGNADTNNQMCYNPDGALYGCGTIFKITASGKLTTLYVFCQNLNADGYCPDGSFPAETLVQGSDGNFYGTTVAGGANPCSGFGCGTVFKITPSGTFTTIYSFCPDQSSCVDGEKPDMLMRAANGNLYGAASQGGPLGGGSIFQISLTGTLTTIYGFCNLSTGSCPDGTEPISLIEANDGNFYGTTGSGGAACFFGPSGCGTIFRLTPSGVINTLHSFCQYLCYDGYGAYALAQATNGALFGLTGAGGADHGCLSGCGTVYRLTAGLKSLVEASPNFGKPGQAIAILGNSLTSAVSVTFNGTTANFSVVSATELKATVPEGATTGTIQVKTSNATILSNLPFQVQ